MLRLEIRFPNRSRNQSTPLIRISGVLKRKDYPLGPSFLKDSIRRFDFLLFFDYSTINQKNHTCC